MDTKSLQALNDTNYFLVAATLLGSFQKITRGSYEPLLDNQGFDTLVKSETPAEVSLQFKHSKDSYCDASLDFTSNGELANVRVLLLTTGIFKKRRTKSHLKRLQKLLKKIARHQRAHLETIKRGKQYRLVSNGLMITLTKAKNERAQPYVSLWCEYLPE